MPNSVAVAIALSENPAAAPQPIGATSPPAAPPERLEPLIGAVVAEAAIQVGIGMGEWEAGGLTDATRATAADRFVELFELRRTLATDELSLSFEDTARLHGIAILGNRTGGRLSMRMIDLLVGAVLEVHDHVWRTEECHE